MKSTEKPNALILYPKLKEEFDFEKNGLVNHITCGSNVLYWFICSKCQKSYQSSSKNWIRVFQRKNTKIICRHYLNKYPRQAKLKTSIAEFKPELLKEWDYELNILDPNKTNYGSDKDAHWVCSKCFSKYKTRISHRTEFKEKQSNCPFCDGRQVNKTNSLASLRPNYIKYLIDKDMANKVTLYSAKKIKWVCQQCQEELETSVCVLVQALDSNLSGCKYCSGTEVNYKNNITVTHPEVAKEWNYEKNEIGPENYTAGCGSRYKVWWKCSLNHEWEASINGRTGNENYEGSGCPFCCHKVSKVETEWLDYLNIPKEYRQINIKLNGRRFKLDALDPTSNTAYEFNGDYYHGNPKVFKSEDFNYICKKTFGELYIKTLEKESILKKYYKVISIWEQDWNILKKENKL